MPLSDKKRRGLIFDAADCSRLRRSRERRSGWGKNALRAFFPQPLLRSLARRSRV